MDSNHRRHCQQIYSLSHLATLEFPHIQLCWSWWTDSNPRPADYKRWSEHQYINFRCFSQLSCRGFGSIQACCVHPEHTLMFPFGSRFGSNGSAVWLVDIHTQFHIVKILLHHDSPRKHPMAHLYTIIRDLKRLHVQRPSAVLADCSTDSCISVPPFHTAFEVSIPQTTDNDKSRRGAQDLRWYKQRKRAFPMCCDGFPHTEESHLT